MRKLISKETSKLLKEFLSIEDYNNISKKTGLRQSTIATIVKRERYLTKINCIALEHLLECLKHRMIEKRKEIDRNLLKILNLK